MESTAISVSWLLNVVLGVLGSLLYFNLQATLRKMTALEKRIEAVADKFGDYALKADMKDEFNRVNINLDRIFDRLDRFLESRDGKGNS